MSDDKGHSFSELKEMAITGNLPGYDENGSNWGDQDYEEEEGDFLRGLPGCFYALAMAGGGILLIFTLAASDELNSSEIGTLIGWTVGAVLGTLGTGYLIELVQRISSDVRAIRKKLVPEYRQTAPDNDSSENILHDPGFPPNKSTDE